MSEAAYLKDVRNQYEQYPYPARDPKDERNRLLPTVCEQLPMLNFYCYGGRQDFRNGYRVLTAGGGTGDATLFIAEQLDGRNAEIIHLDVSEASINVAKARAEARGLDNIRFLHGSLLEVAKLGLGTFDYINCTGVLHHLENPLAGLNALNAVLKDDGVMGIMVYGTYGRTGVYQMQAMLRMINEGIEDVQQKITNAKQVLQYLPATNWLNFNRAFAVSDLQANQDAGIYDLLLHSQDRSYTVPELYEWLASARLQLVEFLHHKGSGRFVYNPAAYIKSPELLARVQKLPKPRQQAIAELICGTMNKHTFYTTRNVRERAQPTDRDMIPFFSEYRKDDPERLATHLDSLETGKAGLLRFKELEIPVMFTRNAATQAVVRLIDGNRTVGKIVDSATASTGVSADNVMQHFVHLFKELNLHDMLFLRHRSVPPFATRADMDGRPARRVPAFA